VPADHVCLARALVRYIYLSHHSLEDAGDGHWGSMGLRSSSLPSRYFPELTIYPNSAGNRPCKQNERGNEQDPGRGSQETVEFANAKSLQETDEEKIKDIGKIL